MSQTLIGTFSFTINMANLDEERVTTVMNIAAALANAVAAIGGNATNSLVVTPS